MIIRQGDVLLRRVTAAPAGAKRVEPVAGRIIVAEGEATGHHHSIALLDRPEAATGPSSAEIDRAGDILTRPTGPQLLEHNGRRYLVLSEAVDLTHQEHATLTLPEGTYEVVIQREYTPSGVRMVAD